ncbi:HAD family hydrolase [Haloactinospora alba]|uniref:HAD family hydrolase n=1 Tax=Haloactinospora alba TaxID=405555 RepID=UPI00115275B0|nr:haloacid dehalogenase-like hydrolase [Haloactinospora alba]
MWNIDFTLVDVARVTRAAYAEAFEGVTGEPLVYLAPMAGRTDSELFFEFLARNDVPAGTEEETLPEFVEALGDAFARRRDQLADQGRCLPGAREALAAVAELEDTVQTAVTGTAMANAVAKLAAFGLDSYLDVSIGGFGSENYPKASLIQFTRMRAAEAHQASFPERETVYVTDSVRDVEAAVIGRARPVAVASGSSTGRQLREAGAHHVLDDLGDTASLLRAVRDTGNGPG